MGTGGTERRILPICEWPRFLFLKLRPTDVLSLTLNIRGMQLIVWNFFTGQTKDSQKPPPLSHVAAAAAAVHWWRAVTHIPTRGNRTGATLADGP